MVYKISIKHLLVFELKSWIGRKIFNKRLNIGQKRYLNLGCGSRIVGGVVNADFYKFNFLKKNRNGVDWYLDLRFPLRCEDEVFNGIFSEHTIEHLYPDEVLRLFKELNRVSKKNSIIRITVPDLDKYIKFYNDEKSIDFDNTGFLKKYKSGCNAIQNITQNYFHYSVWDFAEIEKLLLEAGFNNVKKMSFNESQDVNLMLDSPGRAWETLYVEAQK